MIIENFFIVLMRLFIGVIVFLILNKSVRDISLHNLSLSV